MFGDRYIMADDGAIERCDDVEAWGRFMRGRSRVHHDVVGEVTVSTIFLGVDFGHGVEGPPLIFETMVFGGTHHMGQWRYRTAAEAEAGHARALRLVRGDA